MEDKVMDDRPVFDGDNRLTDRADGMGRRELIAVAKKLCESIAAQAGENGFRGGVRPDNISIGENDSVALGPGGKPEKDKWTAEELEFMAPETFWKGECTPQSDVYSLGLVLYYCCSGGRLPFEPDKAQLTAEDRAETLRRRMSGEAVFAPKSAGKSLGAVIEKAVAFDSQDRYASVSDMPVVLDLCLKELDAVNAPQGDEIFNKPAEELTDVEKMMVGIISRAAENAALSGDDISAAVAEKPENEPAAAPAETPESSPEEPVPEETIAMTAVPEEADEKPAEAEKPEENEPTDSPKAPEEPTMVMKSAEYTKPRDSAPQRTTATPAVQYGMGPSNPEKPKKEKKNKRPIVVLLILCAAMIILAIVIKSVAGGPSSSAAKPAETAAESAEPSAEPTQTPEPTPTPTPTPTPSPEPTYELMMSDDSWTKAENACEAKGGHLVVINDQAELDKVAAMAAKAGARFVWLGCQRTSGGTFAWVNGDKVDFYKWAPGEPSGAESDGTPENYVILWNTEKDLSGDWEYNDVGNDPVSIYPKGYSGRICYICEYDK